MEIKYQNWIDGLRRSLTGNCREISLMMQNEFPELILVRGHYYCMIWGERQHWWLKTINNEIIDPTASQFPSKGCGEYVEWDEGQEEPTGKCLNCESYCFDGNQFCCDECGESYGSFLMNCI